ncbi:MAG TPA: subclass B3 metallo-beta-lactamase [Croceibacterium sp.]
MFVRFAALAAALLAGCAPASAQDELSEGTPLPEFFRQCEGKDGWADPAPPIRVYGNIYDVGTCGIVVLLLAGDEGHILVDTGPAEAAPLVAANIRALGFALDEVKWMVTSHEHHDHVGGVAALQALTGAKLAANAAASHQLATGTYDPADPQFGINPPFDAARVDRVMQDGEELTLGRLKLTMHATPGHSPGSTSWTWQSCDGIRDCPTVAYVDSLTSVSADDYRYSDHPEYLAAFRRTIDKIDAIECDFVITPHPGASQFYERLAGDAPLFNDFSCSHRAEFARGQLEERLAREAAGQ